MENTAVFISLNIISLWLKCGLPRRCAVNGVEPPFNTQTKMFWKYNVYTPFRYFFTLEHIYPLAYLTFIIYNLRILHKCHKQNSVTFYLSD